MKAIRFDRFGGPEELKLVDLPDPQPGPGELLIEVHAVSVVPGDWKLRKGELTAIFPVRPPKVPGRDGAGIVRAVGAGVGGGARGGRGGGKRPARGNGGELAQARRPGG
ncbi:MAG: alcohol dehydrogenase catalytic domain-containing protein, partial [Rhodospirillaceae bacterium]|nr:alcohol dehydrogenase catalytic domain-containing protein [Rhodospirillaceae bacterium]